MIISSDENDGSAKSHLTSDSDSDDPVSRDARRWAVQIAHDRVLDAALPMQRRLENVTNPLPQSQFVPATGRRQMPPVQRSPVATTASPVIRSPPPLHSPAIIRRRIQIHDSNLDDASAASPVAGSPPPHLSPSIIRRRIRIHDSDCDEVLEPQAVTTATPIQIARIKMHQYFASFKGCDAEKLEAAEPVAAPDADLLDLRSAVPPKMPMQFLLLESEHVPADSDDSSGETYSESDSDMESFCDDGDYSDTPEQLLLQGNAAEWMARKLPITAAALKTKAAAALKQSGM